MRRKKATLSSGPSRASDRNIMRTLSFLPVAEVRSHVLSVTVTPAPMAPDVNLSVTRTLYAGDNRHLYQCCFHK